MSVADEVLRAQLREAEPFRQRVLWDLYLQVVRGRRLLDERRPSAVRRRLPEAE